MVGVVSLHNFRPKATHLARGNTPTPSPKALSHALAAGDIATIYNLTPVFAAAIRGRANLLWWWRIPTSTPPRIGTIFRKTFGLARPYPYGTLSQVSPTGAITCTNPGFQGPGTPGYGDDGEAAIDVEWASAAAPNAAIILAACEDTTAFGGLIALVNTLNGSSSEPAFGGSASATEKRKQRMVRRRMRPTTMPMRKQLPKAFRSSSRRAMRTQPAMMAANVSTHGISISGFASTPYNVAVGGLDFGYTADTLIPVPIGARPTAARTLRHSLTFRNPLEQFMRG